MRRILLVGIFESLGAHWRQFDGGTGLDHSESFGLLGCRRARGSDCVEFDATAHLAPRRPVTAEHSRNPQRHTSPDFKDVIRPADNPIAILGNYLIQVNVFRFQSIVF